MDDDYDDMNCCSKYFYIRYAGENTLIDLSMIDQPYPEKNDNGLLPEDDQSLLNRLLQFTKYHSFWFRIFFFIFFIIIYSFIIIYFYNYFYIQPNLLNSSLVEPS